MVYWTNSQEYLLLHLHATG
uniref:Uncharacterized protein n=1 Tax=Rhizophora mucronata TaxID=61149 RepID=A0A2P2IYU5_RHIMU